MFDVQVPTKSYGNALFSENPQNQALHVSDEKSDSRDRKPIRAYQVVLPPLQYYPPLHFQKKSGNVDYV